MNVLTTKWVFKRKLQANAQADASIRYKARLVCRGFEQKHGIDYEETFAPVMRLTTFRIFFAICASLGVKAHLMDVVTAFLNGEIDKEIYVEQPEGFRNSEHPEYVCKLNKSLYGLKQAPRLWHKKIDDFLTKSLEFQTSPYEPCLYYRKYRDSFTMIALYVDDLLIAATKNDIIGDLKVQLSSKFKMNDCGIASLCLGVEIEHNYKGDFITLSQKIYTAKVLERFGMQNSKPVSTPMDGQLTVDELNSEAIDTTVYRQALGSLMYLAIGTRPDITFAVSRLAQYVERPTNALWLRVKRIFRYLSGSKYLGLRYHNSMSIEQVGYSDSDWGGCPVQRKSTSGYVFTMSNAAVCWKSKKQGCIAQSSSEAKYIALATAVKESVWLTKLLNIVTPFHYKKSPRIYVDNQGSISIAKKNTSATRTKHIDIQYHFARDCLEKGLYQIAYIPTAEMIADILTKPLSRLLFQKFREKLGLVTTQDSESQ